MAIWRKSYREWRGTVWGEDYCPPRLAIREGRWKLFCNHEGGEVRLYDIPRDPEERTSLADDHSDVVAALRPKLLAWQKELPPGPFEPALPRPKGRPVGKHKG